MNWADSYRLLSKDSKHNYYLTRHNTQNFHGFQMNTSVLVDKACVDPALASCNHASMRKQFDYHTLEVRVPTPEIKAPIKWNQLVSLSQQFPESMCLSNDQQVQNITKYSSFTSSTKAVIVAFSSNVRDSLKLLFCSMCNENISLNFRVSACLEKASKSNS